MKSLSLTLQPVGLPIGRTAYVHGKNDIANGHNHLIALLPRLVRISLLSQCESVELVLSEIISAAGAPIRHVYFPTAGSISLVILIDKNPALEVALVGREGMLGAQLALDVGTSSLRAVVLGTGAALRIEATAINRELNTHEALRRCMHRYLYVLMVQMAQSAGCLLYHQIDQRLARLLLMRLDRAGTDTFRMTQEALAYMLGVRRVGITKAACELKRKGLIEYRRGELTVLSRKGLEAAACGCYAADHKSYADMLA